MQINQAIQKIQHRRAEGERVTEQLATIHTVSGLFMVSGTGEAAISVQFPVKFIERPQMTFGAELDPSSGVVAGQYPEWSITVGQWLIEGTAVKRAFTGAQLLVKTSGPTGQKLWIHWDATAKATTNPFS